MSVMVWPRALVAAALLCFSVLSAAADVAVPPLKARVTDLTGTLSAERISELERQLAAFEAKKGAQIAVLMVPTVQPETIEQYAVRAFEQWKLGRKGVDDGVLLVIAKDDRKLRIEVGYGLEGVLTDATSKRIISDDIVPQFKRGDFAAGVEAGVSRIISVVGGEALPPPAAAPRSGPVNLPFNPEWLIAAFVLFSVINHGLRAVFGRLGAAGVMAVLSGFILWLVISSLVLSSIAAVVAFVISLAAGARASFGGGSMGGGSWSSGGGGFGGGGFGGGGGRSGGGGASGGW
ncbi:MAG: YgcG family protein [Burkholderiales bacterium]|nr:YgcG family protein [Burkholderiales bacterium]